MQLVDSHCHLNFPDLINRLDAIVQFAKENHVHHMLTVNTSLDQTDEIIGIAEKFKTIFCTVGVHPNDVINHQVYLPKDESAPLLQGLGTADVRAEGVQAVDMPQYLFEKLAQYAKHPKVVGLGETGLDYYYDKSPKALQQTCFSIHLEASSILQLPVVIHTRDADDDTLALVRAHPKATGVFHCFSGDLTLAKAALDLGYYISFSGIVTFKTADVLRDVARYVPLDRLLVETDSPYLTPVPFRGKPNEPGHTKLVAEQIAHVKALSLEEIAAVTTRNFFTLFNKAVQSEI